MRSRCLSAVLLASIAAFPALFGASGIAADPSEPARQAPSKWPRSDKFIPTFAVCYSDAAGAQSPEETARFDMLITSFGHHAAQAWGRDGANSWQTLKRLNPTMVIALYAIGPGEYNTAPWSQIGEGWDWLEAHHGKGSADRWIVLGRKSGGYLQAKPYPNERLMELGNPNWRHYWVATIHDDYWGGHKGIDCQGADALFSDNTQYEMIWTGQWRGAGHPDQPDEPAFEKRDGRALQAQWRRNTNQLLAEAVPYFASRGVKTVLNFGYMGQHPEYWK